MKSVQIIVSFMVLTGVISTLGCFPEPQAPVVKGPVDTKTASKLQSKIRRIHGNQYKISHQLGEKEFTANWEISNTLKKSAQLQIKPSREEWELDDLNKIVEVVLAAHESKPWYGQIDAAMLEMVTVAYEDDNGIATTYVPETPYHLTMKVKDNGSEWFVEAKVKILEEDGSSIGF